jgi:hypothetical protein
MSQLKSFRELKVCQKLKVLHLDVAKDKGYLTEQRFADLDTRYDECGRMLEGLHQALSEWRGTTRTGTVVREERAAYGSAPDSLDFCQAIDITLQCEEDLQ